MSMLLLLAAVLALVVGAATVAHRPTVPGPLSPALRRTAATVVRWRLAGLVLGVAAAIGTAQSGALGRGLLLAAPVFALCVLSGVVVGELRTERPGGALRSAALETRRVRDYLPRRLATCVGTAAGLLAVVLTATTASGSADDLGRAGRELFRRCSAVVTTAAGPWPGSFYALPVAALVGSGLAGAGLALVRIVRRPRTDDDRASDDVLRHRSAEAVTAAAGLLVTVPLAGVAAVAAAALLNVSCAPGSFRVLAGALAVVALAALGLAAWCVVSLANGMTPASAPMEREPVDR